MIHDSHMEREKAAEAERADQLGVSVAELRRRQRNAERLGRFVRRAVAPFAAIAIVAGSLNALEASARSGRERREAAAIAEATTATDQVFAFGPGVNLRAAPVRASSNETDDLVADKVKKGEVLRVDRPLIYTDHQTKIEWFVCSRPNGSNDEHTQNDPNRVFWLNKTDLDAQGERRGQSYYEVYDYAGADKGSADRGLTITVDEQGNFMGDDSRHGGQVGVCEIVPQEVFELEVQREGLQPAA